LKTRAVMVHSDGIVKRFETFMSILEGAHPSPTLAFNVYCIFWIFHFFDILEKVVGPGLQGIHVATPVLTLLISVSFLCCHCCKHFWNSLFFCSKLFRVFILCVF